MFAVSLSQPEMTQLPSLSVFPGTTARHVFTLSSGISVGSYYLYWFQMKPGSLPGISCTTTQTHKHQGPRFPAASLGPKVLQPMQDFCSSLGSSLRRRQIITVRPGTAVLVTGMHTEESGTNTSAFLEPWILTLLQFNIP